MTKREYPQAVTGTWSDVERQAWYLYDNADVQTAERDMAEAVLVLLGILWQQRKAEHEETVTW